MVRSKRKRNKRYLSGNRNTIKKKSGRRNRTIKQKGGLFGKKEVVEEEEIENVNVGYLKKKKL